MKKINLIIISLVLIFIWPPLVVAISISPPIIEFRANPGEQKEFKIKLKNEENNALCFKLEIEAVKKMQPDGSPIFDTAATSQLISPWFRIKENDLCAKSGETIAPTLVIQIPISVESAGYYAVAFFTPILNDAVNAGSSIINRLGVLIALRLDGQTINEQARLHQFIYDENNKKFLIDFQNEGNIHLRPYGEIVIKTADGQEIEKMPFNEAGVLVLPKSNRQFEINWTKNLEKKALATLEVFYGTGPKKVTATTVISARIPKKQIDKRLLVIGLLVGGALILGYIIKKIRKNSAYV